MSDNGVAKRKAAFYWRRALSLVMEYAVAELGLSREESFSYAFSVLENVESKEQFRQFLRSRAYDKNRSRSAFSSPSSLGSMLRSIAHNAEAKYI